LYEKQSTVYGRAFSLDLKKYKKYLAQRTNTEEDYSIYCEVAVDREGTSKAPWILQATSAMHTKNNLCSDATELLNSGVDTVERVSAAEDEDLAFI
jgi:hypothetical protein